MVLLTFTLDTAYDNTNTYAIRKMSDDTLITPTGGSYTIDSYDKIAYIDVSNLSWSIPWKIEVTLRDNEIKPVIPSVYFTFGTVYSNTTYGGVCVYRASNETYARADDTPAMPDNSRVATQYTTYLSDRTYVLTNHPIHGITLCIGGALVSSKPFGSNRDVDTRGIRLYLGTTGGMNCKASYQTWTDLDWSNVRIDNITIESNWNPPRLVSGGLAHHQYWQVRMRSTTGVINLRECMLDPNASNRADPPYFPCTITQTETLAPLLETTLTRLNDRNLNLDNSVSLKAPFSTSSYVKQYWTTLTYNFVNGQLPGQLRINERSSTLHIPQFVQILFSINGIDWFLDDEFEIPASRWDGQTHIYIRGGSGWFYARSFTTPYKSISTSLGKYGRCDGFSFHGISFTICMWAKRNVAETGVLLCQTKANTGNQRLTCIFLGPGLLQMGFYTKGIAGGIAVDTTNWHHVVYRHDITTQSKTIFYDGVQIANATNDGLLDTAGINTFYLGSQDDGTRPFNGSIDEVAIFDVALSQAAISEIYNKGRNTLPINVSPVNFSRNNLQCYYRFNDDDGADSSQYFGRNLTLVGAPPIA